MYKIVPQQIPQDRRAEINEKILFSIDTGGELLDNETIYNCYTGIGGLHDLKQSDYGSYHEYSEAKKEIEMGQFFTPHDVCRQMVELVAPEPTDMVVDMCCGMGNFFNHLPNEHNAYGFDIDSDAVKVARHLYPNATINKCDIRQYSPDQCFDIAVGNPPFNLDFDGTLSQLYYINKAYKVLNPAGLLVVIVPLSFLNSEFWERSRVSSINRDFSFIGQTRLPSNAFATVGVDSFDTKIMLFMRESCHIEKQPYIADEFVNFEELKLRLEALNDIKKTLKLRLARERNSINKAEQILFENRLNKYLFELKAHRKLQKHYDKAIALVSKYRNQKPPDDCTNEQFKEWDRHKLTHAKVLSIIYRYIKNQNRVPRKEVALVKTASCFKLKGYAPHLLDGVEQPAASIKNLIINNIELPHYDKMTPRLRSQYDNAMRFVERKRRKFLLQNRAFYDMDRVTEIDTYINKLKFKNKENRICWFTNLQKHDLGLAFQKNQLLLNWQQGSGKTAAAYHYAKYQLHKKSVRNVVILAPAIATSITWETFLNLQNEKFVVAKRFDDLENVPDGCFVVVSISMQGRLKRLLSRFMKIRSKKVCLIFDESDEITNPLSQRTKRTLSIFRRAKRKILAIGTTTRNNISELYSQLELLYNNSINMLCDCSEVYSQNKDKEIEGSRNDYYGLPFPAKSGANLFKSCFCPSRASVFGIEKQNQDIYNKSELTELIDKSIITRKFKEFASEKYKVRTHTIAQSDGEKEVYRIILQEFYTICNLYFASTGDARKEASLRLIRQIRLLIKACSVPNTFIGYYGDDHPQKTHYIDSMIGKMVGKVAVGCTTLDAMNMYVNYFAQKFPNRPLFIIQGSVPFKKRDKIIKMFEATTNGILVCTQQSLKSSVNIPSCNEVILESLQWNVPKMEQFYFRFIRLDSKHNTNVHFITYDESIEQNILALVLTKERLNEFIKTGEIKEQSDIFDEFEVSENLIENLLKREHDSEGKLYISWGSQKVS